MLKTAFILIDYTTSLSIKFQDFGEFLPYPAIIKKIVIIKFLKMELSGCLKHVKFKSYLFLTVIFVWLGLGHKVYSLMKSQTRCKVTD